MDHEGGHNFFIMPPSLRCVCIKNNAKIDQVHDGLDRIKTYHFDTQCSSTAIATMREEKSLSFKGISPHYCGKGFQSKKKKSLPRHSTVALLSLATEVEELKIEALTPCFFSLYTWSTIRATNGDITRIALFFVLH